MVGTESFPYDSFQMWAQYTNHSFVMGDFIWTAIDYIGESAIGNTATTPDLQATTGQPWQWHISFCGDIDIMGMQKPQAFYRRMLWDAAPITMLVHHPMAAGQTEKVSPLAANRSADDPLLYTTPYCHVKRRTLTQMA